ncbi:hypothetical protein O3P69_003958 [Scylla paramamosain]|uniref:ATP-dependent RNA helicase n=1 Tax=Scylla paramamosain TaxID=85552 RepID=A0AAW0UE95_SCYPA
MGTSTIAKAQAPVYSHCDFELQNQVTSHEFEGLAGFEEVSTCTLIKRSRHGEIRREMWKDGKIVKKKNKKKRKHQGETSENAESVNEKKNSESDGELEHTAAISEASAGCDEEPSVKTSAKKRKKQNKSQKDSKPAKKVRYDSTTYHGARQGGIDKVDVSAWKEVFAPPPVLEALAELGFSQPTEIQKLVLPAAIRDRMDIIGAAETGSGKTLAFGIPIIHGILADKQHEAENPHEESS